MSLFLHELAHFIISLAIGLFVWKKYKKPYTSFFAALLGGFFVDLDHLFDYFFAFETIINFNYFFEGHYFIKSGKAFVPLHAWEWVIVLLFLAYLLNKRLVLISSLKKTFLTFLLAFALGLSSHLLIDVKLNSMTFAGYSFVFRMKHNFDLVNFLSEDHKVKFIKERSEL